MLKKLDELQKNREIIEGDLKSLWKEVDKLKRKAWAD